MTNNDSFRSIINLWPSLTAYAEDIGIAYRAAQVMRWRNSISSDYWSAIVEAAQRRRLRGVTYERLAALRAANKRRSPNSRTRPAA